MVPVPGCGLRARKVANTAIKVTQEKSNRPRQLTPSFFCRLDDDVVYWNTSRLSGYT
jgi:hypothetical protein